VRKDVGIATAQHAPSIPFLLLYTIGGRT